MSKQKTMDEQLSTSSRPTFASMPGLLIYCSLDCYMSGMPYEIVLKIIGF